jgi:hypothetical protein
MNAMGQQDAAREKNDDLDLLLIIKGVTNFLRTNVWRLLGASLAGLLIGIVLYLTLPKRYTSTLLLESTLLINTDNKAINENWDEMIKPAGYPYLMKEFGCDEKNVNNLVGLTVESLNPQSEIGSSFSITATVWDTTLLGQLQTALVHGLTQGEYVRRQVDIRKEGLQQQVDKIHMELARLDSPKGFIASMASGEKKEGEPLILDVSNFSVQKATLAERLATVNQKLAFNEAVYVLQGFSATKGPKPGKFTMLAIGFLGGFLLGYFFLLAASVKRKIARL